MVESCKYKTSTNKVEATNRSYNRSNPKNVTCTHGALPRLRSAVLRLNAGLLEATVTTASAVGHPLSKKVKDRLRAEQKLTEYRKKHQKQPVSKLKRASRRRQKYDLYDSKKEFIHYVKGIGLPTPCSSAAE